MAKVEWALPGDLRLPPSRPSVDLFKLARQDRLHGRALAGMPPIEVTRCRGGTLMINDGVTRATRAFRYAASGSAVPVLVIERRPKYGADALPRIDGS